MFTFFLHNVLGANHHKSLIAAIDFKNSGKEAVVLRRMVNGESEDDLSRIVIDAGEKRRLYLMFPDEAATIYLEATRKSDNKTLAINNQRVLKLTPDDAENEIKAEIKEYSKRDIFWGLIAGLEAHLENIDFYLNFSWNALIT